MRTKKFVFEMLALLVILSMALTSCAPATEAPVATEAPATEMPATEMPATEMPATEMPATESPATEAPVESGASAELIAAAQAEGMLTTIALPHDWCNYEGMFNGFKAKYPDIEVNELDPGGTSGEELEAIRANKDNPGPQAPDVIDVGLSFGPTAKDEGLLMPYKVATWDEIPDGAKDAEGYWYGDYYGVLSFEVNTGKWRTLPPSTPTCSSPNTMGRLPCRVIRSAPMRQS